VRGFGRKARVYSRSGVEDESGRKAEMVKNMKPQRISESGYIWPFDGLGNLRTPEELARLREEAAGKGKGEPPSCMAASQQPTPPPASPPLQPPLPVMESCACDGDAQEAIDRQRQMLAEDLLMQSVCIACDSGGCMADGMRK